MTDQKIVLNQQVAEGHSAIFSYRDEIGFLSEGLIIRHKGRLFAYKNLCRHQPRPLDFGEGTVLTDDSQFLQCCHHGAIFQLETGLCISGPCEGASLFSMAVTEFNGTIEIVIPAPDESFELE